MSSTTRPMRTRGITGALLLMGALVLLAVTACGGNPAVSTTSTTPEPPSIVTITETPPPQGTSNTGGPLPAKICDTANQPAFLKQVVFANAVSGPSYQPVGIVQDFDAKQETFHAVASLDTAPDPTNFRAAWYLIDARGYKPNARIDETEQSIGGTRNIDFTLKSKTGSWPVGTYCFELYANENLAFSKIFQVVGTPIVSNSPVVGVTLAADTQPNTFEPVNPSHSFKTDSPPIHAVVQVQDAAPNTNFKAKWILPAGNPQEFVLTTEGSRRLDFRLTPGPKGFAAGAYKVEIYVNNTLVQTEEFDIK